MSCPTFWGQYKKYPALTILGFSTQWYRFDQKLGGIATLSKDPIILIILKPFDE